MQNIPLRDFLIVKRDAPDVIGSTGLILPPGAQEEKSTGTVLGVGKGVEEILVGDHVLFGQFAGVEVIIDGEQYLILGEDECFMTSRPE